MKVKDNKASKDKKAAFGQMLMASKKKGPSKFGKSMGSKRFGKPMHGDEC